MEQFNISTLSVGDSYLLSEVVVAFQSEDILSNRNSVLTYPNESTDWYK